MPSYEYLIVDGNGRVIGAFEEIDNAVIFIKALFETYYNEHLTITITKKERV